MPDRRQHRGPHPDDVVRFARTEEPKLRQGVSDLSWLLSRGYALPSATQLVGNRYALDARQRLAITRCAASDSDVDRRQAHRIELDPWCGDRLWVDGYNVLTSLEAALSGGVILVGRDGCFRDLASMHGSYRRVAETRPAVQWLGEWLAACGVRSVHWLFDQPVSNSGRLKVMLRELAAERHWDWQISLVPNPDAALIGQAEPVATSDSAILNRAARWVNLARLAIESRVEQPWIVDLGKIPDA